MSAGSTEMALARARSVALTGVEGHVVDVEAHIGNGPAGVQPGRAAGYRAGRGEVPGPGGGRQLRAGLAAAQADGRAVACHAAQGGSTLRHGHRTGGSRLPPKSCHSRRSTEPCYSGSWDSTAGSSRSAARCRLCWRPRRPGGGGSWCRSRTSARQGWSRTIEVFGVRSLRQVVAVLRGDEVPDEPAYPEPGEPASAEEVIGTPDRLDGSTSPRCSVKRSHARRWRWRRRAATTCSCPARPERARPCSRNGCRACCPI